MQQETGETYSAANELTVNFILLAFRNEQLAKDIDDAVAQARAVPAEMGLEERRAYLLAARETIVKEVETFKANLRVLEELLPNVRRFKASLEDTVSGISDDDEESVRQTNFDFMEQQIQSDDVLEDERQTRLVFDLDSFTGETSHGEELTPEHSMLSAIADYSEESEASLANQLEPEHPRESWDEAEPTTGEILASVSDAAGSIEGTEGLHWDEEYNDYEEYEVTHIVQKDDVLKLERNEPASTERGRKNPTLSLSERKSEPFSMTYSRAESAEPEDPMSIPLPDVSALDGEDEVQSIAAQFEEVTSAHTTWDVKETNESEEGDVGKQSAESISYEGTVESAHEEMVNGDIARHRDTMEKVAEQMEIMTQPPNLPYPPEHVADMAHPNGKDMQHVSAQQVPVSQGERNESPLESAEETRSDPIVERIDKMVSDELTSAVSADTADGTDASKPLVHPPIYSGGAKDTLIGYHPAFDDSPSTTLTDFASGTEDEISIESSIVDIIGKASGDMETDDTQQVVFPKDDEDDGNKE